jgi:hypothetical protein
VTRPFLLAAALLVAFAVLAAAPRSARADSADALARQAAAAYAAQKYPDAVAAYEQAVAAGLHDASIYYDLGNAYFRAGQLGRAILWYERALRIEPGFEDARYNLDVAREAVAARFGKDQVKGATAQPFWVTAVHWLPLPLLVVLVLALDLVFFGLLIARRFIPDGFLRTGLGVGGVFAFIAGAAVGVLLFGRVWYLGHVKASVVIPDEVVMRELPDAASRELPKLHAGHRVVLLRESQGWRRIRLANRVEGWVPRDAVEPIALP